MGIKVVVDGPQIWHVPTVRRWDKDRYRTHGNMIQKKKKQVCELAWTLSLFWKNLCLLQLAFLKLIFHDNFICVPTISFHHGMLWMENTIHEWMLLTKHLQDLATRVCKCYNLFMHWKVCNEMICKLRALHHSRKGKVSVQHNLAKTNNKSSCNINSQGFHEEKSLCTTYDYHIGWIVAVPQFPLVAPAPKQLLSSSDNGFLQMLQQCQMLTMWNIFMTYFWHIAWHRRIYFSLWNECAVWSCNWICGSPYDASSNITLIFVFGTVPFTHCAYSPIYVSLLGAF